jgi:uncharacterized protein YbbC (DUF1343 family)
MKMKISLLRTVEYKKTLVFFFVCFAQLTFAQQKIITGAQQISAYLPLLKGKTVGLVVNQTSTINKTHLVDSLKKLNINIKAIFAPEHGFRGDHGAGVNIKSSKDAKTGIKIISLYGNHKKPTADDLKGIQVLLFDIQDVGARFYTYISTLHYVMEACAELKKPLIILDRPNPNGFYIDGPVLDMKYKSFVGMHPIPVVHGLTIGEYAQMINGEYWLKDSLQCNMTVVQMKGYDHNTKYELPVRPSPNLPTAASITLYPSLCFFEGTNYSLGRGTDKPFECFGKPQNTDGDYTFTPKAIEGVAENPPYKNELCRGHLVTSYAQIVSKLKPQLNIDWLIYAYKQDTSKATFFNDFFNTLAGTDEFRKQIEAGKTETEIRLSWAGNLNKFQATRSKYLLYKDFDYVQKRIK